MTGAFTAVEWRSARSLAGEKQQMLDFRLTIVNCLDLGKFPRPTRGRGTRDGRAEEGDFLVLRLGCTVVNCGARIFVLVILFPEAPRLASGALGWKLLLRLWALDSGSLSKDTGTHDGSCVLMKANYRKTRNVNGRRGAQKCGRYRGGWSRK